MYIYSDNNPVSIFDKHFTLDCPHCCTRSNISAISIPHYHFVKRFDPDYIGIAYRCDSCNSPIFLKFEVLEYESNRISISEEYEEIERHKEGFEFSYLGNSVKEDFEEALICYSNMCYNAFASMCRRTVQSVCEDLGAKGKDKVLKQIEDLKEMSEIDDETLKILKQIIIEGHDGAHPYLPKLNEDRAKVLLVLMKDVLHQLYVRKGKLQEAMELRKKAIEEKKEDSDVDSLENHN